MPQEARDVLLSSIPDDMKAYASYIEGRVDQTLFGQYDLESVRRVTVSISRSTRGAILGYNKLRPVSAA